MDYILQMEDLYKFFALSLSSEQLFEMFQIKRKFNNDLNLFGCFIKDFLIIELDSIPADENLYNDFVMYFERNFIHLDDIINKLKTYSSYYLSIVFETIDNKDILAYIGTINSCFALDLYPYIMKIFDEYYNQKVDFNKLCNMLKSFVDIVIKREESPELFNIDFTNLIETEKRLAS